MQPALSLKFRVIGGPQLRTHLSRQKKTRVTFKHNLYLCSTYIGGNVLNGFDYAANIPMQSIFTNNAAYTGME